MAPDYIGKYYNTGLPDGWTVSIKGASTIPLCIHNQMPPKRQPEASGDSGKSKDKTAVDSATGRTAKGSATGSTEKGGSVSLGIP